MTFILRGSILYNGLQSMNAKRAANVKLQPDFFSK
jgi:hypothetical protein